MKRVLLGTCILMIAVAGVAAGNSALHGQDSSSTSFAVGPMSSADQLDAGGLFPMAEPVLGCTSDDCRVCNANGLKCSPNGPQCDCVAW